MIISSSYKTDIPTFYGEWFMSRLKAGYCKMINPYSQKIYKIDLTAESVDGFVFWTKNVGPFLRHLPEVKRMGYPFIVQHTITGYPRELEFRVIDFTQTIEHMKALADMYGPHVAVWRYDPIVISSLTPVDWHRSTFEMLAKSMKETTNEVVVSFAQIYKKTRRNTDWAAQEYGFRWSDHEAMTPSSVRNLISELAEISRSHGMRLKICSQKAFLALGISEEARCVEAERLERVSGGSIADRVELCGHATLASAHVLWEAGHLVQGEQAHFHTLSGLLTADRKSDWIEMNFPAKPEEPAIAPPGLIEALGVPVKYVGKSQYDYLVEVDAEEIVRNVKPVFSLLTTVAARGVIVTSLASSNEYDFVSRFFAPQVGVNEDPVTGSAHCCLSPFWSKRLGKDELVGYQASARGGVVRVSLSGNRVYLGGQAVTVLRGELL